MKNIIFKKLIIAVLIAVVLTFYIWFILSLINGGTDPQNWLLGSQIIFGAISVLGLIIDAMVVTINDIK